MTFHSEINPILGEQRIDKLRFHVLELAQAVEELVYLLKEQGYDNELMFHKVKKTVNKARQDLYGKTWESQRVSAEQK